MQIYANCLNIFKENYNLRWVLIMGVERAIKIKKANKILSNLHAEKSIV
jgi:hypothetical protein